MKRLVIALLFVGLVAGGLGLTVGDGTDAEREAAVPALALTRLHGSGEVHLAQATSAETPTLLWFWAPWCPVCNGEAPKIQKLAEQTGGKLAVVAIGGRDDLANAPEFAAQHGLTAPTLLFDESMQVWAHYRIPGQPGAVLLDRDGREQQRWQGAFDSNLALRAAEAL
ncbi:TlpA family protein disulfide reductase [Solirubrobacter sp. CPCC 204708]|uniref:TlpA family protein disulfide reductase n=1 Tax=Solirubrobacter deserti TaxID=2282478 RepID=A0ABT4RWH5_9ACTN|nr:TlpA disulfide reductase family protein [Solirubrobacter deserti]MBE2320780.1 TlpA family protein disulfide reductase [Solirubrobacter deserti]MDA0142585.1 TlpA family protein disulfide reductase [Solirubrobacter deserti]